MIAGIQPKDGIYALTAAKRLNSLCVFLYALHIAVVRFALFIAK